MQEATGNIYGPDDPVPEDVELIEIQEAFYDELLEKRQKDVHRSLRERANRKANPGR